MSAPLPRALPADHELGFPGGRGLFITGTDTGVGKTVVAAGLARVFAIRGMSVGVMKPAESGCPRVDGRLVAQDAALLQAASGCHAPLDLVNPYRFSEPIAPALAAEMEGIQVRLDVLVRAFDQLSRTHDVVIVEGAGGLLTPLADNLTMADLAAALSLPAVVVARNCLGVINHTALTVRAARAEGLQVLGVVLNHTDAGVDPAVRTNRDALRRWGGAPVLGLIPYLSDLSPASLGAAAEGIVGSLLSRLSDLARCAPC